ncbi:MAG: 4Fe-4S dicluster domain-containing protein [Kiritimatiellia bacterium]|nr:4Fe-4S dicluster domain-containing protein [Kiritimatiellia bacterium]
MNTRSPKGFHVDLEKCIGCKTCEAACRDHYRPPVHIRWRRVRSFEHGAFPDAVRIHLSLACNHCADPACMKGCPVNAYRQREEDGLVIQDPTRCIGCQYCTWTCPYGVPQFDPDQGVVTKCNGCYQRLDAGLKPRCEEACPCEVLHLDTVDLHAAKQRDVVTEAPGFPDVRITSPTTRFGWPKKGPQPDRQVNIAPPGTGPHETIESGEDPS